MNANTKLMTLLSEADRQSLFAKGTRKHLAKGNTLFRQGDSADFMFVIETGQLEINVLSQNGKKVILNHLGAGEVVGEVALLDGGKRSANSEALVDTTGVVLNLQDFRAFMIANPEALFSLAIEICKKLRLANQVFEDQSQKEGAIRLARCLLRLAKQFGRELPGGALQLKSTMSQGDLGDLVGLTRANVNRCMRGWEQSGLVENQKGQVTLLDPARMRAIAEVD